MSRAFRRKQDTPKASIRCERIAVSPTEPNSRVLAGHDHAVYIHGAHQGCLLLAAAPEKRSFAPAPACRTAEQFSHYSSAEVPQIISSRKIAAPNRKLASCGKLPDQVSPTSAEQAVMKTILSHAHLIDCVESKVRPDIAVLIEDGQSGITGMRCAGAHHFMDVA